MTWACGFMATMGLSPEQRSLRASLAAHALHASRDSKELTRAARSAALARFEREVDPDGVLEPAERTRRAAHARSVYFKRLALRSSRARAARSDE